MDSQMDIRIRALAHPLWESAARPYGMALEFWLMAEQMILEMLTASARLATTATGVTTLCAPNDPTLRAPVQHVQDLAHCMWESAGKQYEIALDCWLSAERHALALSRATAAAGEEARGLARLPAPAYLEHVRRRAYLIWESTGRQYGKALEHWLQAEQQVLAALADTPNPLGAVVAAMPGGETRTDGRSRA